VGSASIGVTCHTGCEGGRLSGLAGDPRRARERVARGYCCGGGCKQRARPMALRLLKSLTCIRVSQDVHGGGTGFSGFSPGRVFFLHASYAKPEHMPWLGPDQRCWNVAESQASSDSRVSSHSTQIQSPPHPCRALSVAGTIVTPQTGQMGGLSSSMHEVCRLRKRDQRPCWRIRERRCCQLNGGKCRSLQPLALREKVALRRAWVPEKFMRVRGVSPRSCEPPLIA
jgi:hypothetical protein